MSRAGVFSSAMASAKRATMKLRSWSVISPVVKWPSVPTISRSMVAGSLTRMVYVPKARSRMGPNSGSRIMMGFFVPHLRLVNWRVETK